MCRGEQSVRPRRRDIGDLAARVTASASSFHYGRHHARLLLAQQIHEAASGVVAQLADYGVTAATQELEPTFDEIDALLHDEIDTLLLGFKASDPAFYRDYHAARIIIDRPGGRAAAKATANTAVAAGGATSGASDPTPSAETAASAS